MKSKEKNLIKFGENVYLSKEQYDKLCDQNGKRFVDFIINDLDVYCKKTGKKYNNYFLALTVFLKRAIESDEVTVRFLEKYPMESIEEIK